MSNISTVAPAVKDALYNLTVSLFQNDASVLVGYGHPGTQENDNLILWLGIRSDQTEGPLSVTNRGRDENVEVDVYISSFEAGIDTDKPVSDRAYQLLGLIENEIRSGDPTLGGLVYWCFLTATTSKGSTEPAVIANGRQVDLVATFSARARITN